MIGLSMGWGESYYEDSRREAREVLGSRAGSLLEEIEGLYNILIDYGDFIASKDGIESLLLRLKEYLAEYRIDE